MQFTKRKPVAQTTGLYICSFFLTTAKDSDRRPIYAVY